MKSKQVKMKNILILILIFNVSNLSATCNDSLYMSKKDFKLMADNNIKKFVRKSGSEQKAIDKLMHFCLPDTFFHYDNERLIWYFNRPMKIFKIDYYASRKMQAFWWIQKVYYSNYRTNNKNIIYGFEDESENLIWDYKDFDLDKKSGFYTFEFVSQSSRREYSKKVGYVKTNSASYHKLEDSYQAWYVEMKKKGLEYMRENHIPPPR